MIVWTEFVVVLLNLRNFQILKKYSIKTTIYCYFDIKLLKSGIYYILVSPLPSTYNEKIAFTMK